MQFLYLNDRQSFTELTLIPAIAGQWREVTRQPCSHRHLSEPVTKGYGSCRKTTKGQNSNQTKLLLNSLNYSALQWCDCSRLQKVVQNLFMHDSVRSIEHTMNVLFCMQHNNRRMMTWSACRVTWLQWRHLCISHTVFTSSTEWEPRQKYT
jgi:hypothetical protein